jgi:hypothetical protein
MMRELSRGQNDSMFFGRPGKFGKDWQRRAIAAR